MLGVNYLPKKLNTRIGKTMNRRPRVYVAGPYSADNVLGVLRNIGHGEDWCSFLFCEGFAPFCPWHDKSYAMNESNGRPTIQDFKDLSFSWLEVSEAVFLIDGWEKSEGVKAEIAFAKEHGIPVFSDYDELLEWKESVLNEA